MANLGSEVEGLFLAVSEKNKERFIQIHTRAQKILDEILSLPDMQVRKREIELLRDEISNVTSSHPIREVDRKSLESYFLPFATRVLSQNSQ